MSQRADWVNTTHDWSRTVDQAHLEMIRAHSRRYAPGGVHHLVLEVLAHADDEAAAQGRIGECVVVLHEDGSVGVRDNGRGTDTRVDSDGVVVRKPVMATKDLRFFDVPAAPLLPDGHRRRGMSVVAALSTWLLHTNRRENSGWVQRYEHGMPVGDLTPLEGGGHGTGTTVRFLPDPRYVHPTAVEPYARAEIARFPHLSVNVIRTCP